LRREPPQTVTHVSSPVVPVMCARPFGVTVDDVEVSKAVVETSILK
jgi:hypothetical protein